MRLKINNLETLVSIHHMDYAQFKEEFPELVEHSPKKAKKITVAQVSHCNCISKACSFVHKNDQFNRRKGSIRALERALHQHPVLRQLNAKKERKEIFAQVFRSEPSPYDELAKLVRSRPELAKKLVEYGKTLLSETTNGGK